MSKYVRRLVNLEQTDYWIIQRTAREKGLGAKGFSAALRLIIREWESQHDPAPLPKPALKMLSKKRR